MSDIQAYNLRTKRQCIIVNPEVVTLKNGRKAVRGVASDDGKTVVMRMMSPAAIQDVERQLAR
jgi:hypothetical protein